MVELSNIWPFNDPDFPADLHVAVLSEVFLLGSPDPGPDGRIQDDRSVPEVCAAGVRELLSGRNEEELTRCEADVLASTRDLEETWRMRHERPSAYPNALFKFGIDLTLWRLERSGTLTFAAKEALFAQRRLEGQAKGSETKTWWHDQARNQAKELRARVPRPALAAIAGSIHQQLVLAAKASQRVPAPSSIEKTLRTWRKRGDDRI
jgi:hypothetical protein